MDQIKLLINLYNFIFKVKRKVYYNHLNNYPNIITMNYLFILMYINYFKELFLFHTIKVKHFLILKM